MELRIDRLHSVVAAVFAILIIYALIFLEKRSYATITASFLGIASNYCQ